MAEIISLIFINDIGFPERISIKKSSTGKNLIDLIEQKTNCKINQIIINGQIFPKTASLSNISNESSVIPEYKYNTKYKSFSQLPKAILLNPPLFKKVLKCNNLLLNDLLNKQPLLAEAAISGDDIALNSFLGHLVSQGQTNIFSEYGQNAIAKRIKQENIDSNLKNAFEYAPELFIKVEMLYVPVIINHHQINAFVDTGAQSTIISKAIAQKLELTRLIDVRYRGIAKGVGTKEIEGKIHLVQIKIGRSTLQCSAVVIDGQDIDFILGLDMLRRHLIEIDLKKSVLRIGSDEVSFVKGDKENFAKISPKNDVKTQTFDKNSEKKLKNANFDKNGDRKEKLFGEKEITTLCQLGFSKEQAIKSLEKFGGNVDQAASSLFGDSLI